MTNKKGATHDQVTPSTHGNPTSTGELVPLAIDALNLQFLTVLTYSCYDTHLERFPEHQFDWYRLQCLAQYPLKTEKNVTACIHPSSGLTKTLKAILKHNKMTLLWADIDSGNFSLDVIIARARAYGLSCFIVYSTASAKRMKNGEMQGCRWRVIVRLYRVVTCDEWLALQMVIMKIFSGGSEAVRGQQVLYLPTNPDGGYYEHYIGDGTSNVNAERLNKLHNEIQEENKVIVKAAKKAPITPRNVDKDQGGIIGLVNAAYLLEPTLRGLGYVYYPGAGKWLHPDSTSGNPGIRTADDKYFSHHGCDPLNDGHTHDSFDLLCQWEFGGDVSAAVRYYADDLDPEGQKEQQLEYKKKTLTITEGQSFSLKQFSLNGRAKQMEEKMLKDVFILGGIALLGQATVIYAKPNAGKTLLVLWLLIEAIEKETMQPQDIYYVNADDNHNGLTQKLKLAEEHGFQMLAPGYNDFKPEDLPEYLEKLSTTEEGHGKVLILDTVKKFTDLMNKKVASNFGEAVRQFVLHGGSVIMLAHVNKHRNEDGKVVYSGTADLVDDADCAYILDIVTDDPLTKTRTVKFENLKSRGDVASEEVYSYDITEHSSYLEKLGSVTLVGEEGLRNAKKQCQLEEKLNRNREAIDAIIECLKEGPKLKTELIKEAMNVSGISRKKIITALAGHVGNDASQSQYWIVTVGESNAHKYELNHACQKTAPMSFLS